MSNVIDLTINKMIDCDGGGGFELIDILISTEKVCFGAIEQFAEIISIIANNNSPNIMGGTIFTLKNPSPMNSHSTNNNEINVYCTHRIQFRRRLYYILF